MMVIRLSDFLYHARRFVFADNANIAMIFGLALIPITAAAGTGLDLARAMSVRTQLTTALDAAGLAAGNSTGLTTAQMQSVAQKFFDANYKADSSYGAPAEVSVAVSGASVTVSSNVTMPTTLMAAVGIKSLPIGVSITVTRESKKVEIVMALDNTGSMGGSKLRSLKNAATTLVDTLAAGSPNPALVKFGLVPFSQTVRLDTDMALDGGWIDKTCQSSISKDHFDHDMCAYTVLQTMSNTRWRGCVEARPDSYAILDSVPTTSNGDTLFVPYFQPDEPDNGWQYPDSYLDDGKVTNSRGKKIKKPTDEQLQENSSKYDRKSADSHVNGLCTDLQTILPLTNDVADVKNQIDDMEATGNTHIVLGATWGWRVLSPGAPYTEGVAYDDPEIKKILILMTDGENTLPSASNSLNKSRYTAFGYLKDNRLGTSSSISHAETVLDNLLTDACSNIKAAGITIYTIGFQISSTNVKNLLKGCATNASMFYDSPTSSALETAFASIANDISNLRVSK